ncbi:hypothetical protein NPIL_188441 [Nephila pilipes]|uniref:Uncharacterized protein n=1 Tax=Nephila pilipes TaxID=299642 RepID=A0A8X6U4D4_NEPPI|nr:hypothetical protein NPIL_188441 [Nephila pilipes]
MPIHACQPPTPYAVDLRRRPPTPGRYCRRVAGVAAAFTLLRVTQRQHRPHRRHAPCPARYVTQPQRVGVRHVHALVATVAMSRSTSCRYTRGTVARNATVIPRPFVRRRSSRQRRPYGMNEYAAGCRAGASPSPHANRRRSCQPPPTVEHIGVTSPAAAQRRCSVCRLRPADSVTACSPKYARAYTPATYAHVAHATIRQRRLKPSPRRIRYAYASLYARSANLYASIRWRSCCRCAPDGCSISSRQVR